MKLNPTNEEFTDGVIRKRFGEKQREAIAWCIRRGLPMALSREIEIAGKTYTMVQPVSFDPIPEGLFEFRFAPVWNKALLSFPIRCNDLRMIVVQFEHGQFAFTAEGEKPSAFTFSGPGVDPKVVRDCETVLAAMIGKDNRITKHVWSHINQRFGAQPCLL